MTRWFWFRFVLQTLVGLACAAWGVRCYIANDPLQGTTFFLVATIALWLETKP